MNEIGSSSSSRALPTAEMRALAEYYADEECARIRPRNHAAYRATVLARKLSELLDTAAMQTVVVRAAQIELETSHVPVDSDPEERWLSSTTDRRALIQKLLSEQATDASWARASMMGRS